MTKSTRRYRNVSLGLLSLALYGTTTETARAGWPGFSAAEQLEAEDASEMNGVEVVFNRDVGQDRVVGYINHGDGLVFENFLSEGFGTAIVSARVASKNAGGEINIIWAGESIGRLSVPSTGSWNEFVTVQSEVVFPGYAVADLELAFEGGPGYLFDVNWLEFDYPSDDFTMVSARNANDLSVGETEVVHNRDVADDAVLGYIHNEDQNSYTVNVQGEGIAAVKARVASPHSGGDISFYVDGQYIGFVEVPNTGSFFEFQTATGQVSFPAIREEQDVTVVFRGRSSDGSLFDVNWFEFSW